MTIHEKLQEAAREAARNLHGDTTVPLETTLASLQAFREEVTELIELVQLDIENPPE